MSENLTPEVLADLKAKSLGEKLCDAFDLVEQRTGYHSFEEMPDHAKSKYHAVALKFSASLSHDETATTTIQALTARAEKAEQQAAEAYLKGLEDGRGTTMESDL